MAGLRATSVTTDDNGDTFITISEQLYRGSWTAPKTAASVRNVFVPPPYDAELREHMVDYPAAETRDGTVFSTPSGTPLHYNNFLRRIWHPLLDSLGLERTGLHALRRTFVDIALDAGVPPQIVADITGHTDVKVIMDIYRGKSTPAKLADAAKLIGAANGNGNGGASLEAALSNAPTPSAIVTFTEPTHNGDGPSVTVASGIHSDGRIDKITYLGPDATDEDFDAAL